MIRPRCDAEGCDNLADWGALFDDGDRWACEEHVAMFDPVLRAGSDIYALFDTVETHTYHQDCSWTVEHLPISLADWRRSMLD